MTIFLKVSEDEAMLIKRFEKSHGISVSELLHQTVLEIIQDEYDLQCYEKDMASHRNNLKSFTLDEVESELGLK